MSTNRDLIVGFDPATTTGWSVLMLDGTRVDSGSMSFATKRTENPAMRYLKAELAYTQLLREYKDRIVAVVYEEVRRHMGTQAAHVYGALEAEILKASAKLDLPCASVPIGTIKSTATGKGNAKKEQMIEAAEKQWAPHKVIDDNEADALWVAETWRRANFGETK